VRTVRPRPRVPSLLDRLPWVHYGSEERSGSWWCRHRVVLNCWCTRSTCVRAGWPASDRLLNNAAAQDVMSSSMGDEIAQVDCIYMYMRIYTSVAVLAKSRNVVSVRAALAYATSRKESRREGGNIKELSWKTTFTAPRYYASHVLLSIWHEPPDAFLS
jgi:hypothetical protein